MSKTLGVLQFISPVAETPYPSSTVTVVFHGRVPKMLNDDHHEYVEPRLDHRLVRASRHTAQNEIFVVNAFSRAQGRICLTRWPMSPTSEPPLPGNLAQ